MNHNKIKAFLKKNGVSDYTNYELADNGDGKIYISKWKYEIDKPTKSDIVELTNEEIKNIKTEEFKKNRAKFFNDPDFIKFMFSDIDEVIDEYLNLNIKLFDE